MAKSSLLRLFRWPRPWVCVWLQFDFRHLHRKSGSAARYSDFAVDLRALVSRQSLPGYQLDIVRMEPFTELLAFRPVP